MLAHHVEDGVLVLTVHTDFSACERADLTRQLIDWASVYQPAPVVVVIEQPAGTAAVAGAVLQCHRQCSRLGLLMSVVTHSSPMRRLLMVKGASYRPRLVVHSRIDVAITATGNAAA